MELRDNQLLFAKVRENAIIPTKNDEDAGRDLYACFDDDIFVIPPHKTALIPTGIASAFTKKYEARIRDRGSNGSKGLKTAAGTIDSGFRGEWFVAWINTNDQSVIISKLSYEELLDRAKKDEYGNYFINYKGCNIWIQTLDTQTCIIYPYSKAIAQVEMQEVPVLEQSTVELEELLKIESIRGEGSLGSSGK